MRGLGSAGKAPRRWAVATLAAAPLFANADDPRADPEAGAWAAATESPDPVGSAGLDPLASEALAKCGPGERGLRSAAARILALKLTGQSMPELDAIAFAQRASGEPHPWARAWSATGKNLGSAATLRAFEAWLGTDPALLRRCGVASANAPDGAHVLVVISVDALADLAPLPTRARVGQWLTVEARLRVPARGGHVFLLGPGGAPRSLLTSFEGGHLRARFALDSPGEFAVQVMADLEGGPRPVLEASVFADIPPPASPNDRPAPGEGASEALHDDVAALDAMLSLARDSAGLPNFARDPRLDAVAREHALRMARRQELSHDAGDGDPIERLHAAALRPSDAGENVAHAKTIALAHRATWHSPAHRSNLLRRDFRRVGLAAARDEHGDAWVVELFASDDP